MISAKISSAFLILNKEAKLHLQTFTLTGHLLRLTNRRAVMDIERYPLQIPVERQISVEDDTIVIFQQHHATVKPHSLYRMVPESSNFAL